MSNSLVILDENEVAFDEEHLFLSGTLEETDSDVGATFFIVKNTGTVTMENIYVTLSALKNTDYNSDGYSEVGQLLCTGSILEIKCDYSSQLSGDPSTSYQKINWDEEYSGSTFSEITSGSYNRYIVRLDPSTGDYDSWKTGSGSIYFTAYGEQKTEDT